MMRLILQLAHRQHRVYKWHHAEGLQAVGTTPYRLFECASVNGCLKINSCIFVATLNRIQLLLR